MAWIIGFLLAAAGYLWCVSPRLPRRDLSPLLGLSYAHRGLFDPGAGVPENSLPAFRLAREAGYGVELDVQLSRDGVLMVFHDDSLARLCGCNGAVADYTAQALGAMPLMGTAHTLPTLEAALETLGDTPLIVEIKPGPRVQEAARLTARRMAAYPGPWCLESFHPMALWALRKYAPQAIRGQLAFGGKMGGRPHRLRNTCQKYLLHLGLSRPDFLAYQLGTEGRNLSWRLHRFLFHTPLTAWTVKTPQAGEDARAKGYTLQIFEGWRPKM